MPTATIDGIETNYEIIGAGPPILMFSPGGFDATLDKWSSLGIYARIRLLDHLPKKYRCIIFDRRETGRSGGRIERITWDHYSAQGMGLLDHLGIDAAHVMGGCMGCCAVVAFGIKYPKSTLSMINYWPVGGAAFRIRAHDRFMRHLGYMEQVRLSGIVELARSNQTGFGQDPRVGPWAPLIRSSDRFAEQFAAFDPEHYKLVVAGMARTLIDRDTAPGAEPEDLMSLKIPSLIVPGRDLAHATSAARYLEECLPEAEYWDALPGDQTEESTPPRIIDFLDRVQSDL